MNTPPRDSAETLGPPPPRSLNLNVAVKSTSAAATGRALHHGQSGRIRWAGSNIVPGQLLPDGTAGAGSHRRSVESVTGGGPLPSVFEFTVAGRRCSTMTSPVPARRREPSVIRGGAEITEHGVFAIVYGIGWAFIAVIRIP